MNVAATVGAILFVDRAGRRMLLLGPTVWMFLMQIILAVVLAVEFHKFGEALPSATSIGILIVICSYVVGHAIGLGPLGWLYPTEVQPLETRAAGAGVNTASNMVSKRLSFELHIQLTTGCRKTLQMPFMASFALTQF